MTGDKDFSEDPFSKLPTELTTKILRYLRVDAKDVKHFSLACNANLNICIDSLKFFRDLDPDKNPDYLEQYSEIILNLADSRSKAIKQLASAEIDIIKQKIQEETEVIRCAKLRSIELMWGVSLANQEFKLNNEKFLEKNTKENLENLASDFANDFWGHDRNYNSSSNNLVLIKNTFKCLSDFNEYLFLEKHKIKPTLQGTLVGNIDGESCLYRYWKLIDVDFGKSRLSNNQPLVGAEVIHCDFSNAEYEIQDLADAAEFQVKADKLNTSKGVSIGEKFEMGVPCSGEEQISYLSLLKKIDKLKTKNLEFKNFALEKGYSNTFQASVSEDFDELKASTTTNNEKFINNPVGRALYELKKEIEQLEKENKEFENFLVQKKDSSKKSDFQKEIESDEVPKNSGNEKEQEPKKKKHKKIVKNG